MDVEARVTQLRRLRVSARAHAVRMPTSQFVPVRTVSPGLGLPGTRFWVRFGPDAEF